MDRRTFLKATLVTAGSMAVGCGDDDDPIDAGQDVGGGSDAAPDADAVVDAGRLLEPGEAFFPQSVVSGDPKPESVILWARVEDPAHSDTDVTLELQVALDENFQQLVSLDGGSSLMLEAQAQFDHCVKVKVTELDSATYYYYRFIHQSDDVDYVSRTGRAKTAPAPDADVEVRFAFVTCQDYNGRYYNAYRMMAKQDLDFFAHLGDYIYETTGDPQFQTTHPDRAVTFTDEAGAIVFNEGEEDEFFAAKSLSNYRELYKIYRSDLDCQKVHELFPMIVIWDDHEYSDDCYGATATYYDGQAEETDVDRRKAANQAWFEYMPVDYPGDETFEYDSEADYPDDIRIYRDFDFGANVHLALTDLRTYRPDHVVPEDALPGALAMNQTELTTMLGGVPDWAIPYVDIATYSGGIYQTALADAAAQFGYDPAKIAGFITVDYINARVTDINETSGEDPIALISDDDTAAMERGFAFSQMLKTAPYSDVGARYFLIKDTFELYSAFRYAQTSGASENLLGEAQETWFLNSMSNSTKTWKVWGNEFCLINRYVDLRAMESLPEDFRQVFQLSAEDWDGFPNYRDALIEQLSQLENVVAVTGDIHAFFAGTPWVRSDHSKKVVEFVGSAISSATFQEMLVSAATSDPVLNAAGAVGLAALVDQFIIDGINRPNPNLCHADSVSQGFVVARADSEAFYADYYSILKEFVSEDLGDDPANLDAKFNITQFKVNAGESVIYRNYDGVWRRWDYERMTFVEE